MADDDYADDFAEEGGGMNPGDAVAAQIELAQNEQEMAARKHLRSLRPQKVRKPNPKVPFPCFPPPKCLSDTGGICPHTFALPSQPISQLPQEPPDAHCVDPMTQHEQSKRARAI